MEKITRLHLPSARADGGQVLHIDFDSFFASCEQQDNPYLRNKPLGVTAANGRTCIIASSREAKRLGIKTGSRTYEVFQICPDLKLVSANFVKYFEISKKFLKICQNFSPDVELFSIDEVFMDVTLTNHLFGGVYNTIKLIKNKIKEEIGEYITVSIGISHNRLLAKLASGINKPNGIFEIRKDNLEAVYSRSKLTDVCGIGNRIKLRLNKIGIYSLLELRDANLSLLIEEFGDFEGHFLKNIGLGIDSDSLNSFTSAPDVKSVGRNYCLPKNEHNKTVVLQNIYELCEEIGIKLRRLNKKARTVGFYFGGNINLHGRKTYNRYFDRGSEMFDLIKLLFDIEQFKYVRQIGIWAGSLKDSINTPLSLFDSPKQNSLQKTIDKINERFGDHTIRNGFLLYADKLTTVPNGYMADKYERTKLALGNINYSP
ncbi:MAG: DNA polymerase IV [Candidatus Levybacteria bacterium]|nr:DNA polymerase IV [Candidatus Levybacteria bacterium]